MSAWQDEERAYEEYQQAEYERAYEEWARREQQELDWLHRFAPGGIEEQYQNWCRENRLDPEDVGSMTAYEGL